MAPAFSKFTSIPPKLQIMVWERVPTPVRIILGALDNVLDSDTEKIDVELRFNEIEVLSTHPLVIPPERTNPPILHVCHLSRVVGLKRFKLYTSVLWLQDSKGFNAPGNGVREHTRYAYVDYETDIFSVGKSNGTEHARSNSCAPGIQHAFYPFVYSISTTTFEPPADPADPSTWDPVQVGSCVEKTRDHTMIS
ncbi:hypothetical protein B0T22DRAFT_162595 [Podospora appendiculata]|uniref:2EXR domain-containing protein n=1 Tax=Podospora appendiculata TaxID=314037 RepID=A0AAE0XA66_9PEZI|nr:hypothetical protein B0T22DRAFT_162595 [Podospora appendiculata]